MKRLPKPWAGLLLAALIGTTGAAQAQILVGQTAGFTGPVAAGVKETTDGARSGSTRSTPAAAWPARRSSWSSLDDKFDPKLAAENARKLIEEQNVSAMFLTRGTPHTEAIIPLLEKHGVALVGPSTGAMVLHQPVRRHVFNVRATYQREAERPSRTWCPWAWTRIAVVHADDSFGADGLAGREGPGRRQADGAGGQSLTAASPTLRPSRRASRRPTCRR
jgi:branched-chain amino acid transport system substrate-binding protein